MTMIDPQTHEPKPANSGWGGVLLMAFLAIVYALYWALTVLFTDRAPEAPFGWAQWRRRRGKLKE